MQSIRKIIFKTGHNDTLPPKEKGCANILIAHSAETPEETRRQQEYRLELLKAIGGLIEKRNKLTKRERLNFVCWFCVLSMCVAAAIWAAILLGTGNFVAAGIVGSLALIIIALFFISKSFSKVTPDFIKSEEEDDIYHTTIGYVRSFMDSNSLSDLEREEGKKTIKLKNCSVQVNVRDPANIILMDYFDNDDQPVAGNNINLCKKIYFSEKDV